MKNKIAKILYIAALALSAWVLLLSFEDFNRLTYLP